MYLTPHWKYIEEVARQRLANNKTSRHIADYGTEIETMGAAGELAARIFFGLSTELHTHFDRGTDFKWAGKNVDVKTTKLTPKLLYRFLQWPITKPIKCDIVLLTAVSVQNKSGLVVGYLTGEEMKSAAVNQDRDYPCREIPTSMLRPAWMLFASGMNTVRSQPVPA